MAGEVRRAPCAPHRARSRRDIAAFLASLARCCRRISIADDGGGARKGWRLGFVERRYGVRSNTSIVDATISERCFGQWVWQKDALAGHSAPLIRAVGHGMADAVPKRVNAG